MMQLRTEVSCIFENLHEIMKSTSWICSHDNESPAGLAQTSAKN